jgi:hypothetical protein
MVCHPPDIGMSIEGPGHFVLPKPLIDFLPRNLHVGQF